MSPLSVGAARMLYCVRWGAIIHSPEPAIGLRRKASTEVKLGDYVTLWKASTVYYDTIIDPECPVAAASDNFWSTRRRYGYGRKRQLTKLSISSFRA